jgi:hypothetical protein
LAPGLLQKSVNYGRKNFLVQAPGEGNWKKELNLKSQKHLKSLKNDLRYFV